MGVEVQVKHLLHWQLQSQSPPLPSAQLPVHLQLLLQQAALVSARYP